LRLCRSDPGVPRGWPARNTAVPETRTGLTECRRSEAVEATNSLKERVSGKLLLSKCLPFFQVVIIRKTIPPIAKGIQPPSLILVLFAARNASSIPRNGTHSAVARRALHFQTRRTAKYRRTVVAIIVKVTAMP
jgi:hypothetical protein